MKTHITLDKEIQYKLKQDDFALEVDIHPQQLKWLENTFQEYYKAQKYLQDTYDDKYGKDFS